MIKKITSLFVTALIILFPLTVAASTNTNSLLFDSIDSNIEDANGTNIQGITATNYTVEFWVNITTDTRGDGSDPPRFVHIGDGTNSLQIMRGAGIKRITTKDTLTDVGLASIQWGSSDLTVGTWYHVAVEGGAGGVSHVYLAAKTDSTHTDLSSGGAGDSVGAGTLTTKIYLGARSDHAAYLVGKMDEVRVWNSQLSSATLDANFKKELTGSESGLIAYYKLNNSYNDSTSNANNLTAVNSPSFSTDVPFTGATGNGLLPFLEF